MHSCMVLYSVYFTVGNNLATTDQRLTAFKQWNEASWFVIVKQRKLNILIVNYKFSDFFFKHAYGIFILAVDDYDRLAPPPLNKVS